jgi:sacsin
MPGKMDSPTKVAGGEEDEFSGGLILPPLVIQLRKILDQYSDDTQILKELIQNAEDAGATEVKFLYDKRQYGTDVRYLHHPKLANFQPC